VPRWIGAMVLRKFCEIFKGMIFASFQWSLAQYQIVSVLTICV